MNLIISCCTFKERLQIDSFNYVFDSIKDIQKDIDVKFVLSMYKDHTQYISNKLKKIIEENNIELILSNENIKSHNKYYYVMMKYRDIPILTIDDDSIYNIKDILDLYKYYKQNDDCVVCNCSKTIHLNCKYSELVLDRVQKVDFDILPIGVGGILYPPNILNIQESDLNLIKKHYFRGDDIFLKYKEYNNNVKCFTYGKQYPEELKNCRETPRLCNMNYYGNYNDIMIQYMNEDLKK